MAYIKRHLNDHILTSLNMHPVVFLNGPRQAGKLTLAKKLLQSEYVSFDNAIQMAAANHAPELYLREHKSPLIIDEVQMVPGIFRAIKVVVDKRRLEDKATSYGNYLLTGSANIMALPKLADALVGRMGIKTLYPLCGSEALNTNSSFIDQLFRSEFSTIMDDNKLSSVITHATFPDIFGASKNRRASWLDDYLTTLLQRDVRALMDIEKIAAIPHLLRILATRCGGLINDADIARDAKLNTITSRNYKTLLKMLFLTFEVPSWHRNLGKRLVKASKGYLIDTSLFCHLLQYDLDDLTLNRPELFGHVLENFVATELTKLLSLEARKMGLYHFRTSDQKEVDFVIEKANGTLAGIEVKNSDHVQGADFKGLETLQDLTGPDFISGVVLYRGDAIVPFGKNLWAIPISQLWH